MSDTTETETDTDTTDEPSKAELHDRVEKLESTVEKLMPSRRDALRLGAAGLAGAAGLSATTQPADAATGSAGQIGDSGNRPDVFADTVDANQLTGVSTGAIKTKTRVFLSSNSSASPIPFDGVSYDPDNNFDTTNHTYTVPATGTYLLVLSARLDSSAAAGTRAIFNILQFNNPISAVETQSTKDQSAATITDVRQVSSGDPLTVENVDGVTVKGIDAETFLSVIRLE